MMAAGWRLADARKSEPLLGARLPPAHIEECDMDDPRVPTIRARFVRRAEALQDDPAFRRALDAVRSQWNRSFPRFRLCDRPYPPQSPCRPGTDLPLPPTLVETLDGYNRRLAVGQLTEKDRGLSVAVAAWREPVLTLCRDWWPESEFPNWVGRFFHPAMRFVGACLIWDPQCVPVEWIALEPIPIREFDFDPDDPESHPETVYWKRLALALLRGLNEQEAASAAAAAALAAAERRRATGQTIRFVPLFPGMGDTDWVTLRARISELAHAQQVEQRRLARELHSQGEATASIACRLGVTERTIRNWLKRP